MFVLENSQNSFSRTGNNTEKIWAHQFLSNSKMVGAGDLGGAVSLLEAQGDALVKGWVQIPDQLWFFLYKTH